jgi:two-component system LytT family response regulator
MKKSQLSIASLDLNLPDNQHYNDDLPLDSKFFEDRVAIRLASHTHIVQFSEIVRIEADGGYCTIFLQCGKKLVVSKTLSRIARCLQNTFVRVHQSHIINLLHLKVLDKKDGYTLIMSDESKIALSTRKRESFLQKLDGFKEF